MSIKITELHRYLRKSYGGIKILEAVKAQVDGIEKVFTPEQWCSLLDTPSALYRESPKHKYQQFKDGKWQLAEGDS